MLRACLPLILVSASFAQSPSDTPEKAPPEVDAALRARVTQFFQAEVDGKFRQAEQFVAEDAKDVFVGSNKPRYTGFEIWRITYSDHFTKALVEMTMSRLVPVPGFEGRPLTGRMPSRWKLENGEWYWYADTKEFGRTPFGTGMPLPGGSPLDGASPVMPPMPGMAPGGAMPPGFGAAPGASMSNLPPMPDMGAQGLTAKVDKTVVALKASGESSDQVTISNQAPTPITLTMNNPDIPGLTLQLDRTEVKPGGKAILRVQSGSDLEAPSQPITINIRVLQTNQVIPIQLAFAK